MCAAGCAYDVIIEKQAKQEDIAFLVDRGNTDTHTHLGHVPNHITKKNMIEVNQSTQTSNNARETNQSKNLSRKTYQAGV